MPDPAVLAAVMAELSAAGLQGTRVLVRAEAVAGLASVSAARTVPEPRTSVASVVGFLTVVPPLCLPGAGQNARRTWRRRYA